MFITITTLNIHIRTSSGTLEIVPRNIFWVLLFYNIQRLRIFCSNRYGKTNNFLKY
jgi:hypothetical protein